MQAPVTQLYENTWAIEDRGVRIFVLERVFPEKAVVRQMRRKNPLIGHRTEYVCQWKILLNMRIFMYILYMQSADW